MEMLTCKPLISEEENHELLCSKMHGKKNPGKREDGGRMGGK